MCIVDPLTVCVGQRCRWGCNRLLMRAACMKDPPRRRDYFSVVFSIEALLRSTVSTSTFPTDHHLTPLLVYQSRHINIAQVHVGSRSGRQDVDIKVDRRHIHEYLFREGALVAKKDFNLTKHSAIYTKNLFVIKACRSLTSRGYLKTRFSWQYHY